MAVESLNKDNFGAFINSPGNKVIDFWAEFCAPCKVLAPVLSELSAKYTKIKIAKCDISEDSSVASKFNISSVPCLIVFNEKGEEISRQVGFKGKASVEELLSKYN